MLPYLWNGVGVPRGMCCGGDGGLALVVAVVVGVPKHDGSGMVIVI